MSQPPPLERLPPPLLRDEPWANGHGRTTELARAPAAPDWRWRISIAQVDAAGPFSDYPGTQRQLAALDGRLRLRFGDAPARTLARLQVLRFAGSPAPYAELPDGPVRVFNLITRECEATLLARPLVGALLLPAAPLWLVHALAGGMRLQREGRTLALEAGATARLAGGARLDGQGEVLLVRVQDCAEIESGAQRSSRV